MTDFCNVVKDFFFISDQIYLKKKTTLIGNLVLFAAEARDPLAGWERSSHQIESLEKDVQVCF